MLQTTRFWPGQKLRPTSSLYRRTTRRQGKNYRLDTINRPSKQHWALQCFCSSKTKIGDMAEF